MKLDAETVKKFHCPRWNELPTLDLYMDQVLMVLQESLEMFSSGSEPVATPSMINNYVKQRMIAPPIKKKYGRTQIARLLVITVFKRAFSMAEIAFAVDILKQKYGTEEAYDLFCARLEDTLVRAFASTEDELIVQIHLNAPDMVDVSMAALVGKLMVQNQMQKTMPEGEQVQAVKRRKAHR